MCLKTVINLGAAHTLERTSTLRMGRLWRQKVRIRKTSRRGNRQGCQFKKKSK